MRSKWKANYLVFKSPNFLSNSSVIFNSMLKKKIHFYNGKEKKFIFTEKLHVGLRLGEFCFTRKIGVNHKKKLLIKKTKK